MNTQHPFLLLAASFVFMISILAGETSSAAEIKVATGHAPFEIVLAKNIKAFEAKSGHKITIVGEPLKSSSVENYKRVLSGEADFAMAPFAWPDWVRVLKSSGATDDELNLMARRTVGHDYLQLFAHKGLSSIKKITPQQAKKLITGEIKNWKDINGPDVPVRFVLQFPSSNDFTKKALLDGGDVSKDAANSKDPDEMMKFIAKNPGSFGAASISTATKEVEVIQLDPPVGRPITAITKGKPKPEVIELLDYLVNTNK